MYKGKATLGSTTTSPSRPQAYRQCRCCAPARPGVRLPRRCFLLPQPPAERGAKLSVPWARQHDRPCRSSKPGPATCPAYIPPNVNFRVTEGQIFLTSDLFNSGLRQAMQCGHLVEPGRRRCPRPKATRRIAAHSNWNWLSLMKLARPLPVRLRFSTHPRQKQLGRGHPSAMRELLKQPQFSPLILEPSQVAVRLCRVKGLESMRSR